MLCVGGLEKRKTNKELMLYAPLLMCTGYEAYDRFALMENVNSIIMIFPYFSQSFFSHTIEAMFEVIWKLKR